jgi:hypothetical protein
VTFPNTGAGDGAAWFVQPAIFEVRPPSVLLRIEAPLPLPLQRRPRSELLARVDPARYERAALVGIPIAFDRRPGGDASGSR